jgi:hypothetical protein
MYNIGVGLDASLLLCLNNGFADLVFFGNNLEFDSRLLYAIL